MIHQYDKRILQRTVISNRRNLNSTPLPLMMMIQPPLQQQGTVRVAVIAGC